MERFAAIDFEIANGKRSSICSIGVAIIEDNKVIDSVYMLVRPYPNFYTRFTTCHSWHNHAGYNRLSRL